MGALLPSTLCYRLLSSPTSRERIKRTTAIEDYRYDPRTPSPTRPTAGRPEVSGDPFYTTKSWHRLKQKTKVAWRHQGKPCGYCGLPLDWDDKQSLIVDHIQNRKQYPDLAMEPTNLQVVHHACNKRKAVYVENNTKVAIGLDGFPAGW